MRMKQKVEAVKSRPNPKKRNIDEDEEIDSDLEDNDNDQERGPQAVKNDPFFRGAEEEDGDAEMNETVEEKRLKMAKQLLNEIGAGGATGEFFENLYSKADAEAEIMGNDDDMLARRLKYQILEKKGKLFYNIAEDYVGAGEFQSVFLKGHKKAITALEWSKDNKQIFTASKDCSLIQCKTLMLSYFLIRGLGKLEKTHFQRRKAQ